MNNYAKYFVLILYISIYSTIIYLISNIILNYVNIYIFNIITYIFITIVQLDNFTIYNDYKELQKKFEKIIKDEYRMKILTIKNDKLSLTNKKLLKDNLSLLNKDKLSYNKNFNLSLINKKLLNDNLSLLNNKFTDKDKKLIIRRSKSSLFI